MSDHGGNAVQNVGNVVSTIGKQATGTGGEKNIFSVIGGGANDLYHSQRNPFVDHPGEGPGTDKTLDQMKEDPNSVFYDPAPPKAPTIGNANYVSLAGQMDQERQMRYANPNLTGGQGLLDQPTTASHALLGS